MAIRQGVSLIFTVLNEADGIEEFLDGLLAQTVLPEEIVIVDGGSVDNTVEVARNWSPPAGCRVTVVSEPGAGISRGRNRAIAMATQPKILVTDAGTRADPRWTELMMDAFASDPPPDVVAGFFHPTGATLLQRSIAFAVTPMIEEIDPETFLPSSRSVGFTRAAWESVGGYPEWLDYCEDLVFDLALKQEQCRFAFVGSAQVSWSARATLRDFMKQYYRYARGDGKAQLWRRRHVVRYASYLSGVVLVAAALRLPWIWLPLGVAGCAYLVKFWRRIVLRREQFGADWPLGILLVPVIVAAGDLAKMVGYPVGLRWRRDAAV